MAQDKYNYGLSLLRVFLTIFVILNHFWESDVVNRVLMPLSTMRSVAVPTFMLMSFYLTARKISSGSSGDLKKRIVRLAIPFFVWGGKLALDVFNPEGNWNADNKRYFCTWLAIVDRPCFPC